MLSRLSIRDIVLIDRLDIDFAEHLAVLTGETGAGKSILLDAFALALGGWAAVRFAVAGTWRDPIVAGPFRAEQVIDLSIVIIGQLVGKARKK